MGRYVRVSFCNLWFHLYNALTISLPCILPFVVFLEVLFSALLLFIMYATLSVLWPLPFPLTTTFMHMTLSCSFVFTHSTLTQAFLTFKMLFNISLLGWLLICLLLRLNSCSLDSNQLAKVHNSSLDTSHSVRNLGFIFDEHLTFSDQITSPSKACYYHIRQLCSFAVLGLTSILQLHIPLLPLSSTPNWITAIL